MAEGVRAVKGNRAEEGRLFWSGARSRLEMRSLPAAIQRGELRLGRPTPSLPVLTDTQQKAPRNLPDKAKGILKCQARA